MITVCEYGKDAKGKRGACYSMSTWNGEEINPFSEECQIYTAAKNKYEGKGYKDPFKNLPVQTVVNESANIFEKTILKNAVDIFPYDMTKGCCPTNLSSMKCRLQNVRKMITITSSKLLYENNRNLIFMLVIQEICDEI